MGVPQGEVDLILVNGESVNFNYRLQHEDKVSVYPIFEKTRRNFIRIFLNVSNAKKFIGKACIIIKCKAWWKD